MPGGGEVVAVEGGVQDAHRHLDVRNLVEVGGQQPGQNLQSTAIRLPQEGLHVDRDPGAVDGAQAPFQGLLARVQHQIPIAGASLGNLAPKVGVGPGLGLLLG